MGGGKGGGGGGAVMPPQPKPAGQQVDGDKIVRNADGTWSYGTGDSAISAASRDELLAKITKEKPKSTPARDFAVFHAASRARERNL